MHKKTILPLFNALYVEVNKQRVALMFTKTGALVAKVDRSLEWAELNNVQNQLLRIIINISKANTTTENQP